MLRTDTLGCDGRVLNYTMGQQIAVIVPNMQPGEYLATLYDTLTGTATQRLQLHAAGPALAIPAIPLRSDLALGVTPR
jgi:hypothetical protein